MELLNQFKKYLLQGKNRHSKTTVKSYLSDVKKFVLWFEDTFHTEFIPGSITKQLAQLYLKQATTPNNEGFTLGARSLKRYESSLRKFFTFMQIAGLATQNPFESNEQVKAVTEDPFHLKEFKNYLLLSHTSKATRKNYLLDIAQFSEWIVSLEKPINISEVTIPLVEEYKSRLLFQAKFAPVSVNRKLSSLRKYFSWAKSQDYIINDIYLEQVKKLSKDMEIDQATHPLNIPSSDPKYSQEEFKYSPFPPFRLAQKLFRFGNAGFDLLFLFPVVKSISAIKYQWWKLRGGKIFPTQIDRLITTEISGEAIRGLPKAFYAPLRISTAALPLHLKIYHHLRYSRPAWYKKYHSYVFAHYVHFGILLVYAIFLGFTIYNAFIQERLSGQSVLGINSSPARVLSFKGRLTDATNTPITEESNLRFSLYTDKTASGSALIWQETQIITPDFDGNFETTLGQNQSISQQFLNDHPNLFIGIAIENGAELKPRQQVATVLYSRDSERVQGMLPTSDPNAGGSNILLALDSSGDLTIGGKASPKFEAIEGEFILSGQTLTLTTGLGSNTNINISPDGSGIIDLQKPIQNTTNYSIKPGTEGMVIISDSLGIISESSTQSALLINQNSTGNLISANNNDTAKFTVDHIGTGTFAQNLAVNGNKLTTTSSVFSLLDENVLNLNIGGDASVITIGAPDGLTLINNVLKVGSSSAFQGEVTTQGLLTVNGGLNLPGFLSGSIPFIDANKRVAQDNSNFFWDQTNKRLGLGTILPSYRLDVHDEKAATVAAQIYNTHTGTDADGLNIRLGNGSASIATTNHFINFETAGLGEVASIQGNGSNGIQITNAGFADWAEYIDKDPNEIISFGSLVCIRTDGKVTSCDEDNNKILGVASEYPTIIAGKNKGDGSIAVGLIGLVNAYVSTQNGDIQPGDLISYSDTPGIGVKAIQKGMVVGRALEAYKNVNSTAVGKVLIVIQINFYDPGVQLTEAGNLPRGELVDQFYRSDNSEIDSIIEKIKIGILEATAISTQTLKIANENITVGSQTLKEYISSMVTEAVAETNKNHISIVSPILEADRIRTNFVSPLANDASIALKFEEDKLSIINPQASESAVASIDNQGNARFAGSIEAGDASIGGTLRAQRIVADQIEGLNVIASSIAANITNITNVYQNTSDNSRAHFANLNSEFATFSQGIIALGASSLTNVSVTGILHIGNSLAFSENAINTLGDDLELQPLRQGNLSIMGGLVSIDTQGNLNVQGNASFAKDATVHGILAASVISPVPGSDLIIKLGRLNQESRIKNQDKNHDPYFMIHDSNNKDIFKVNQLGDIIASGSAQVKNLATNGLSIIRGVQADTSSTETIASGSAGTAVISANRTERTIKTPYVKEGSLIYISATSDTFGTAPYIARQTVQSKTSKGSFTIQIPQAVGQDIKLNWWIVN